MVGPYLCSSSEVVWTVDKMAQTATIATDSITGVVRTNADRPIICKSLG
jgi:hypothetical protein